ncbi:MAG: helix-hairpin-helix domain-containing protein [Saprospiraceae bacterium]|nr:helix-hairpin-helix domain-containing protein [Saprospiraceae bacterium]
MFENNPFATHTFEILIMLSGAFLLGLWLGWVLWGKLREIASRLRVDNQSLNVTVDTLRQETDALKTRAITAEADNNKLATQIVHLNREHAELREKAAYLETSLSETHNRNRQIETELGLSFTPDTPIADDIPLEIKTIVEDKTADETIEPVALPPVETTPEIAAPPVMLVEPVAMEEATRPEKPARQKSSPAAEPLPAPAIIPERDDLTVVEGIGPKIQMLLNQYGIHTYRQLAEADVARLKEILAAAGPQLAMHDPGTWPSQANLAANDQWDTLKSVQGFLKGGKKPD